MRYNLLGQEKQLFEDLRLLGVKQIQLDSLGHLITPWAASAGFWAEVSLHCRNVLHVHDGCRRDSREFAHRALDCCNGAPSRGNLAVPARSVRPLDDEALG